MFTSKGLFSNIGCPHQQSCLIPNCIFSHTNIHTRDVQSQGAHSGEINLEGDNQSSSRKKQRLDDGQHNFVSGTHPSFQGSLDRTIVSTGKEEEARSSKSAFTRQISPPPLRRKPQDAAYTASKERIHPRIDLVAVPIVVKPIVGAPAKLPVKSESLNPRILKAPSPATHDMRLKLVRALHAQLQRLNLELAEDASNDEEKLVLTEQNLISKALGIEEEAAGTPSIYSNMVKNKIMLYKRMNVKQWIEERTRELAKLEATKAVSLTESLVPRREELSEPLVTGLDEDQELELLPRLYTPITGLTQHGYVNKIPSEQEIELARRGVEAAQGWEQCDRCRNRFQVFPGRREKDGALTSGGHCTYHYGKPYWQERSALNPTAKREKRYRCCNEATGDSAGCTKAENHVFKIAEVKRLASILNFKETPENPMKTTKKPVCIDGEMGYTVFGLELIRLTATTWPNGDELFDVLVRPMGEVLDLNSRYSGVWSRDMAEALPWTSSPLAKTENTSRRKLRIVESPAAARALLFSHLSPTTPLIGHGLEKDLNASRIIQPPTIDTALLYPHKAGLPYRNSLKILMQNHLNRQIQVVVDGKMEGHDSKEDANAAGDLVKLALKREWEKMQRMGWILEDGIMKPPSFTKEEHLSNHYFHSEETVINRSGRKRLRDEMNASELEEGELND